MASVVVVALLGLGQDVCWLSIYIGSRFKIHLTRHTLWFLQAIGGSGAAPRDGYISWNFSWHSHYNGEPGMVTRFKMFKKWLLLKKRVYSPIKKKMNIKNKKNISGSRPTTVIAHSLGVALSVALVLLALLA